MEKDTSVNQIKQAIQETESLLEQAASASGEQARSLYNRMAAKLNQTKGKLLELESAAMQRAKQAARATDDYVHDHPWQAVGAGMVVGVLIGVLIARR